MVISHFWGSEMQDKIHERHQESNNGLMYDGLHLGLNMKNWFIVKLYFKLHSHETYKLQSSYFIILTDTDNLVCPVPLK